jgi:hypothetical protein
MNIAIIVAALAVAGFTSFAFTKAGIDKLKTSDADLLARGWGWVKSAPKGTTKFIGLAELLGGLGVILAPVAVTVFKFNWALPLGIAAGIGLVTIMVLANLVHIVRKEFKYTYKSGLMLLAVTVVATVLLSIYPTA